MSVYMKIDSVKGDVTAYATGELVCG